MAGGHRSVLHEDRRPWALAFWLQQFTVYATWRRILPAEATLHPWALLASRPHRDLSAERVLALSGKYVRVLSLGFNAVFKIESMSVQGGTDSSGWDVDEP